MDQVMWLQIRLIDNHFQTKGLILDQTLIVCQMIRRLCVNRLLIICLFITSCFIQIYDSPSLWLIILFPVFYINASCSVQFFHVLNNAFIRCRILKRRFCFTALVVKTSTKSPTPTSFLFIVSLFNQTIYNFTTN